MEFTNLVDLIQVFANEYCSPNNVILIIGNDSEIESIKNIFKFIKSEVIIVDKIKDNNVDIVIDNTILLPFQSFSFDLICWLNYLDFKTLEREVYRIIKQDGKILINNFNKTDNSYKLGYNYFNVVNLSF